jgi:hypothetical protein
MTAVDTSVAPQQRQRLLGIYLNDHLAGATGGVELINRLAAKFSDRSARPQLGRLAAEISQDRQTLLAIMAAAGVQPQRVRVMAGWAAEKLGRTKLNGYLLHRSPLSDVIELETMLVGIGGKVAVWGSLATLSARDHRFDGDQLQELITRAHRQEAELEALRTGAVIRAMGVVDK